MSSRTSRTSTSSPCLALAARAARQAKSTDSVTARAAPAALRSIRLVILPHHDRDVGDSGGLRRSEERRVGKERRSRRLPDRVGIDLVALVLAALFGRVAVAAFGGGEM